LISNNNIDLTVCYRRLAIELTRVIGEIRWLF